MKYISRDGANITIHTGEFLHDVRKAIPSVRDTATDPELPVAHRLLWVARHPLRGVPPTDFFDVKSKPDLSKLPVSTENQEAASRFVAPAHTNRIFDTKASKRASFVNGLPAVAAWYEGFRTAVDFANNADVNLGYRTAIIAGLVYLTRHYSANQEVRHDRLMARREVVEYGQQIGELPMRPNPIEETQPVQDLVQLRPIKPIPFTNLGDNTQNQIN